MVESTIRQMTEQEFADELLGALVILSTTSGDKRENYALMTAELGRDLQTKESGMNFFFSHVGMFNIAPQETPEREGDYAGNLDGKSQRFMAELSNPHNMVSIRQSLRAMDNVFDHERVNIMGMTEDSGWEILFENAEQKKTFLNVVKHRVSQYLRPEDSWVVEKIFKSGFPGPNLKPIQEHLPGRFDELMRIIYDAAEAAEMDNLRFKQTRTVSFVSPFTNSGFTKEFSHTGSIIPRKAFMARLATEETGMSSRNSNFVQVVDGQKGIPQTLDKIEHALLTESSAEYPANFAMRDMGEWLQKLVGKGKTTHKEGQREVKIAYATPGYLFDGEDAPDINAPNIKDLKYTARIPTVQQLKDSAHKPILGAADEVDAIVLVMQDQAGKPIDENLRMLLNIAVSLDTDPRAMGKPVIVDNTSGSGNAALRVVNDIYNSAKAPFRVANTREELEEYLYEIKAVCQRAPRVANIDLYPEGRSTKVDKLEQLPEDDIFTVFVAGGHANDASIDKEAAIEMGYMCAQNGWRVVTGGGAVRGSMGGVHTGFIKYHLEQFFQSANPKYAAQQQQLYELFEELKLSENKYDYDFEKIIEEHGDKLEHLADIGAIPRDLFYAYSMESMLQMEGIEGKPPPGVKYINAGNRIRRLEGLLAADCSFYMPGGVGTLEEMAEDLSDSIREQLDPKNKETPKPIVVYNRRGCFENILQRHGMAGNSPEARARREKFHITVVDGFKPGVDAFTRVQSEWQKLGSIHESAKSKRPPATKI